MRLTAKTTAGVLTVAMLASPAATLSAQDGEQMQQESEVLTTVYGEIPADLEGMPAGPTIDGYVSARDGNRVRVTAPGGTNTVVNLSQATEIRSSGGFLGLDKDRLGPDQLMNGLPVEVQTVQWGDGLIASRIALKSKDLKTAAMIQNGTDQRFTDNEAATEALRGRMADIDKYNIKGTTNVYFDTGKYNLSGEAESNLCAAAQQAQSTENALLLVVGYTDSTGDYEFNQTLSEKRAARVVNYLQQNCGWAPYRMLTPTGMAEADPLADNTTEEGKAQNRRVAVNILVSKSVDGF
ncbi:OmpA family protein [Qipengyuania sp.]|uniref:OmpA family protein n=1 Tax=Qipengyuania sp. TaxID=2004515 RepID=UPI003734D10C